VTRDPFEDRLKLHSVFRDSRWNRNSYFEKLAILDGGTVALVVTAVLGLRGRAFVRACQRSARRLSFVAVAEGIECRFLFFCRDPNAPLRRCD